MKKVLGVIGVLWGGLVVVRFLMQGAPPVTRGGAYGAGQKFGGYVGLVFGGLILLAGIWALMAEEAPRRRKPVTKKKRRPRLKE